MENSENTVYLFSSIFTVEIISLSSPKKLKDHRKNDNIFVAACKMIPRATQIE
jgi:hypothetical protein